MCWLTCFMDYTNTNFLNFQGSMRSKTLLSTLVVLDSGLESPRLSFLSLLIFFFVLILLIFANRLLFWGSHVYNCYLLFTWPDSISLLMIITSFPRVLCAQQYIGTQEIFLGYTNEGKTYYTLKLKVVPLTLPSVALLVRESSHTLISCGFDFWSGCTGESAHWFFSLSTSLPLS